MGFHFTSLCLVLETFEMLKMQVAKFKSKREFTVPELTEGSRKLTSCPLVDSKK